MKPIKVTGLLLIAVAAFISCNNSQLAQQYKTLHEHDSMMVLQTQTEDSTIKGYINNMNDIQASLDSITTREKILTVSEREGGSPPGARSLADIRAIDAMIIRSEKQINALHARIRGMGKKETELEAMVTNMNSQLNQKDSEIVILQGNLSRSNNDLKNLTTQFNDSMLVIQTQNSRISNMTNQMNTVYYAVGTMKELKDNNVVDKTGGFAGIGRNANLKPDFNTTYFTQCDLTKLNIIPLNAKFKKLLTTHPSDSYKIIGNDKIDSLVITNPSSFWSSNKYMVVVVK